MIQIQITIQAVPERKEIIEKLQENLRKWGLESSVSYDFEHKGSWWNLRNILQNTKKDATHHLVLQDDAVVSDNFKLNILNLIQNHPNNLITLYANRREIKDAYDKGLSIINLKNSLSGLANIWPVSIIEDFIIYTENKTWTEKQIGKNFWKHDDCRIQEYVKEKNLIMLATVPCLVEHADGNSIVGNCKGLKRRARVYFQSLEVKEWK